MSLREEVATARVGRIFLGPEPPVGGHKGYRGPMHPTPYGVELCWEDGVEALFPDYNDGSDWPMGDWLPIETNKLIPWPSIDLIEWDDPEDEST